MTHPIIGEPEVDLDPNDPIRNSSPGKRWILALVVMALPVLVVGWGIWSVVRPISHPNAVVEIPMGSSILGISQLLEEKGIIPNRWVFLGYNVVQGKKLKAGEYEFPNGMSMPQVYRKLAKGDVITYTVRMIEGWNMMQLMREIAASSYAWPTIGKEFLEACKDPAILAAYGIEAPSCEGYLFPDTYKIQRPKDAASIVKRLLEEYKHRVTPEMMAEAKNVGLTWPQVMTLASIVEKETAQPDERPHIAGVFFNRLKINMPLASDPTVLYGIDRADNKIYRSDLERVTPYNTYKIQGLPPGPIASPSMAAIQAVLHPMQTEDLYFVSKNDGTHFFSKDYATHAAAVQQYQR